MSQASIDSVFSMMDREVWILTATAGSQRGGLTVTLVSQASISVEHPRVWVGLSPQHFTTGLVKAAQSFRLHLVGPEHVGLVYEFGSRSGYDVDKFVERDWPASVQGHPTLTTALGWLECSVESHAETGDRLFF